MKDLFPNRRYVVQSLIILAGIILVFRLFYMQVAQANTPHETSERGAKVLYPTRGILYDRSGKRIVVNEPIYEVTVVLNAMIDSMDVNQFCSLLDISDTFYFERLAKLRNSPSKYSPVRQEVFMKQVSKETVMRFEEHLHMFPGFQTQTKSIRSYPYHAAAHVVGDIGEVSQQEIDKSHNYYLPGEYVGKSGLEKFYEEVLRGKRGVDTYIKDNLGRNIGEFYGGIYDTAAIAGQDIQTTLDIALQQYGEYLMQNKRGSIVAIEPSTGEVLAWVSSPNYDPNMLTGRKRGENYKKLLADTWNKPLINRPLTARYTPGSTFKPIMGLIAVQEGIVPFDAGYPCGGGYVLGGHRVGCHGHPGLINLNSAIQYSCNAYFCNAFRRMLENPKYKDESEALTVWADYLHSFGLGQSTGIDLQYEYKGLVPGPSYYDKIYHNWRWRAVTIISVAFGRGELELTPLQMANAYAVIANKGFYIEPHLIKNVNGVAAKHFDKHFTKISPSLFEKIYDGLADVVTAGTARQARIDDIPILGKTGTCENKNGAKDHAVFCAFAPRENPQIAIAVLVENAGYGGSWAAPIASLMIEKYLKGEIRTERRKTLEEKMATTNLMITDAQGTGN